ncbi:PDR/VanB family oxidoreductase [Pararhodobacter oceanensis]|uniref:Oxidoreductase n=1 Tax=Pararhodobacter oceanensis TaxID=2172121 RepID=A0A2T8HSN3_9RHOB|nr:PDR/VanB family oxidoreductase [Pararhodobacter oceanensis]PVH28449.1 oxidoreductase [Pararhodobacter oceanensis]
MEDSIVSAAQLEVEIAQITQEAEGVVSLILRAPDGTALPTWQAGAHIDVILPNGLVRQYSLCGDAQDCSTWRISILHEREGRGGSAYLHGHIKAGDRIRVSQPRNNFKLAEAEHYKFVAGGIGITPILAMIHEAEAAGKSWSLLYGGRSRNTMAFLDDLARFGDKVTIAPQDEVGLLDLGGYLGADDDGAHAYVCGPGPLIDAVEAQCASWPAGRLHRERFAPKQKITAEPGGFEVQLAQSGERIYVPPDESLLDVLQDAGHEVTNSCTAGICGTCLVNVLAGEPDHQDDVLSDADRASGKMMLVCVSRSKSDLLVLDL